MKQLIFSVIALFIMSCGTSNLVEPDIIHTNYILQTNTFITTNEVVRYATNFETVYYSLTNYYLSTNYRIITNSYSLTNFSSSTNYITNISSFASIRIDTTLINYRVKIAIGKTNYNGSLFYSFIEFYYLSLSDSVYASSDMQSYECTAYASIPAGTYTIMYKDWFLSSTNWDTSWDWVSGQSIITVTNGGKYTVLFRYTNSLYYPYITVNSSSPIPYTIKR
jgi:hypothetical protein